MYGQKIEENAYEVLLEEHMKSFKANYATTENAIRAYGGVLEASSTEIDEFGEITLSFNRAVVYDAAIVEDFIPNYVGA